jgi:hypothetical protein
MIFPLINFHNKLNVNRHLFIALLRFKAKTIPKQLYIILQSKYR